LENIKVDINEDITQYPFNQNKLQFTLNFNSNRVRLLKTYNEPRPEDSYKINKFNNNLKNKLSLIENLPNDNKNNNAPKEGF